MSYDCIEEYIEKYYNLINDENLIEMYKNMGETQLKNLTDGCIEDLKKYYKIKDDEIKKFDVEKIDNINDKFFNPKSNIKIVEVSHKDEQVSHKDIAIYFLLCLMPKEISRGGGGGDDNIYEKLKEIYFNNPEIIGGTATLLIVLGLGLTAMAMAQGGGIPTLAALLIPITTLVIPKVIKAKLKGEYKVDMTYFKDKFENISNFVNREKKYSPVVVPDDNNRWYGGENNCNDLIKAIEKVKEKVKENIIKRVKEEEEKKTIERFRGELKRIEEKRQQNEGGKRKLRKSKKSKKSKKVKGKKSKKVKMTKKRKAKKTMRKRKLRK